MYAPQRIIYAQLGEKGRYEIRRNLQLVVLAHRYMLKAKTLTKRKQLKLSRIYFHAKFIKLLHEQM